MEKEFEIKINNTTNDAVKAIFSTQKDDLELRLPLNNGSFDFSLIQEISNHSLGLDNPMFRDTNVFMECVLPIIEDRLYKEIELYGEPRTGFTEVIKAVHGDIEKGFNSQLSKHHKKQRGYSYSM